MVVWCKLGLEFLYRQRTNNERVRQRLALVLSSLICFWPLFDRSDTCWSWRLNILVPISLTGRLIYKGTILKDPEDVEVRCFSRSGAMPSELLLGPLQWMVLLTYLGLNHFMERQAAVTVAAVFLGDSWLAPTLGQEYGRHHYQMPLARRKTMEGSLVGVFLGTCVGSYIFLTFLGLEVPPLRVMLVYGALAAVAEGTAPGHWDNVAIALILQASWDRVPLWLPSDENTSVAVVPIVVS
mmetsp:Transcript_26881/g.50733  ORF Transcript_26881/g.50733 Transcript_26881/m.50733 type:complete len:239 (+) Transcript_26881:223-939(+)